MYLLINMLIEEKVSFEEFQALIKWSSPKTLHNLQPVFWKPCLYTLWNEVVFL